MDDITRVIIVNEQNGEIVNSALVRKQDIATFEVPDGHYALENNDAGSAHRIVNGKIELKLPTEDQLRSHVFMRYIGSVSAPYTLRGGKVVWVDDVDWPRLARLAELARRNKTLVQSWPSVHKMNHISLTAAELLELNDAVTDYIAKLCNVVGSQLDAIGAGKIKTDHEVDRPPASLSQWPERYRR